MSSLTLFPAGHWPLDTTPAAAVPKDRLGTLIGLALMAAITFFCEANLLMIEDVESVSLNWQKLLRVGLCLLAGAYGVWNFRRAWPLYQSFSFVAVGLLWLWLLGTSPLGVQPKFSAASTVLNVAVLFFLPALLAIAGMQRTVVTILATQLTFLVATTVFNFVTPDRYFSGDQSNTPADEFEAGRLGGLQHPNGVAYVAACAVCLLLALGAWQVYRWRTLAFPLLATFAAILATGSRTMLAAALLATAVFVVQRAGRLGRVMIVVTLAIAAAGLSFGGAFSPRSQTLAMITRRGSVAEIYTATGRTDVWRFCWERIQRRKLCGYGFGASRFVIQKGRTNALFNAHNIWLEVMIDGGFVAGALLAAAVGWQLLRLVTRPEVLPDMLIMVVLVAGLAESEPLRTMPGVPISMFLLGLLYRRYIAVFGDDMNSSSTTASAGVTRPSATLLVNA